jgi:hypothetical protein
MGDEMPEGRERQVDHSTRIISELSREDCLALLRDHEVGRVAVVLDGRPRIFPVNYVLDGELVVFRTDPGLKLSAAAFGWVAFEVDEIDPDSRSGWSVVVAGMGREITGALDRSSEREQAMPLAPWAGGAKEHWVRIIRPEITGRSLHGIVGPR